ncbi:MAG TPA: hypothetical protein VMJ10_14370 [Kofleriaceae bacterium]|nr:hypothetical protein [Kofleriaceae bacterium]
MAKPAALVSWSSGKDSAYALAEIRRAGQLEIAGLLTTFTTTYDRVAMHGVRRELVQRQAQAVGTLLFAVELPSPCSNEAYECVLGDTLLRARAEGVTRVVFGDLYLEDIRAYREAQLAALGMTCVFPLWGRETAELAREMVTAGLRARLTCVDPRQLDRSFAGRTFDADLLRDLPPTVDPCGERGEFHTFATDGPMFAASIAVRAGEIVERDGFVFADVFPA